MSDVYIVGAGQVPVSKGGQVLGRDLAARAVHAALDDAELDNPDALYIGNMMSGLLSDQQQLGALVAQTASLRGVEAATVEAACASGAAAARVGYMAIASGLARAVVVAGVEKMTHAPRDKTTAALATASDWLHEGSRGESFLSLNARLMATYMSHYGLGTEVFAPFSVTAHDNACDNPNALFHKDVDLDTYLTSKEIIPPVKLYDASPVCDGAAAIVLCNADVARAAQRVGRPLVKIRASAVATDSVGLDHRRSLLRLDGVVQSSRRAFEQAGIGPSDVDLFELHDAYTIISVLSLEGAGFAAPGEGWRLGADGRIGRHGQVPIATMGGLKGRGHPVGATGVYQLVEAWLQLIGRAGAAQIPGVEIAMTQNLGGTGATVVTHLLTREA
ncbi:MAG: acetyl-CoA acetyltransferase [Proteobacteria bacterium]|nr:MAG: acetyl-CoA acetyltransferase [Pseudomonadota bacterium]